MILLFIFFFLILFVRTPMALKCPFRVALGPLRACCIARRLASCACVEKKINIFFFADIFTKPKKKHIKFYVASPRPTKGIYFAIVKCPRDIDSCAVVYVLRCW